MPQPPQVKNCYCMRDRFLQPQRQWKWPHYHAVATGNRLARALPRNASGAPPANGTARRLEFKSLTPPLAAASRRCTGDRSMLTGSVRAAVK